MEYVSNICLGILPYGITDHLPLFIILDLEYHKIKNVNKTIKQNHNIDNQIIY